MINKICESLRAAVADIEDGSVVMIGGFGNSGIPMQLIEALRLHGARELTIISNNAGTAEEGIAGPSGAQDSVFVPALVRLDLV